MGRKAPSRVRIPPSPLPALALGRRLHSCIAAPVAQLDRASVYGTEGQRFESSRARFVAGFVADLSAGPAPKIKSANPRVSAAWSASFDFLAHFSAHRGRFKR